MAMSSLNSTWRRWPGCFFLLMACVCCWLISCCQSDEAAAFHEQKTSTGDIVGRALFCFNDRYIYSGCQGSFRLGPEGALAVPPASTEAFCGGPCLEETTLVLRCVDGIMDNFRFYNGASARDVRFALDRGCGHTGLRGDFDVLRRLGGGHGDGFFYGHGSGRRFATRGGLALLLGAVAVLLWG